MFRFAKWETHPRRVVYRRWITLCCDVVVVRRNERNVEIKINTRIVGGRRRTRNESSTSVEHKPAISRDEIIYTIAVVILQLPRAGREAVDIPTVAVFFRRHRLRLFHGDELICWMRSKKRDGGGRLSKSIIFPLILNTHIANTHTYEHIPVHI